MKKIYFATLVFLIIAACREDHSDFVNPDIEQQSGDNRKCQVLKAETLDGKVSGTFKYELDSVITESINIEDGEIRDAWYLHVENARQFIFLRGSRDFQNAETRIYLNEDGSIAKEIGVILNPDGETFTEESDQVNIFTYNSKKQLVKIDVSLEGYEKGVANLTYDNKNRIQKIVFLDESGKEVLFYDNFTYEPHAKNDNLLPLDLFDSFSSYFIPSLRNVYLKGYRIYSPEYSFLNSNIKYTYQFRDGKLSDVSARINGFGFDEETLLKITLNCKE